MVHVLLDARFICQRNWAGSGSIGYVLPGAIFVLQSSVSAERCQEEQGNRLEDDHPASSQWPLGKVAVLAE